MKKLAIITTHPIQYYAPMFKLLASSCNLKVFYTLGSLESLNKFDKDFAKNIDWDIPLLEGYNYEFLKNSAKNPGTDQFRGIQNPKIIQTLKSFNPDAILIYGWAYQSHLKVMRHFKGKIPIWFRGDSTLLDEKPIWKKLLRNALLSWVYGYVDRAFYVGTANKAYFKAFGLKEEQLAFAPHAVDNNRFADDRKKEANELRKELNIKPEDILVLFAGKLEPKKDPELLLQAFIELIRSKEQGTRIKYQRLKTKNRNALQVPLSYSDEKRIMDDGILKTSYELRQTNNRQRTTVHLLFVGNGVIESSLKSQISNLKSDQIHFLDFQNQTQMPVLYQACDLFCLPSKGPGETWGLAVNEAMAAGKAVLLSEKVGCVQDLINKKNGHIFKAGNIEDLSKHLGDLIQDKNRLKEMGLESKKVILNWSLEVQISQILKLIDAAE